MQKRVVGYTVFSKSALLRTALYRDHPSVTFLFQPKSFIKYICFEEIKERKLQD